MTAPRPGPASQPGSETRWATEPRPAPDWYPDPFDPRAARWWNGQAWTQHVEWIDAIRSAAATAAPTAWDSAWAPGTGPPPTPGPARNQPRLDRAQSELRARSPQPWGWRPVVLSVGALIGLIVAGLIASATIHPHGNTARTAYAVIANVVVEALLALAVWRAGREVARRNGGWAITFGLRRPRWADAKWVGAGIGITFLARGIVVAVANALSHGRASTEAENLSVHHVDAATVVLLVGVAVIAAPFIEELVFRGLLLRTFMRRMKFWPAAALSTLVFAALHTYEVSTLVGAVTLAASVACLGLTNCWLNRRTDSLAPGMIVHALFNLLAVIVLVVQAH